MKKIILFLTLVLLLPLAYGIDSITCTPTDVNPGSTITCEVDLASGVTEKNQAYTFNFYNDTNQTQPLPSCSFSGTTENAVDPANVVQGCTLAAGLPPSYNGTVNFSIASIPVSTVFWFNITEITAIDLTLSNFQIEEPCYIGTYCGISWDVSKADNNKKVIGADCQIDLLQNIGGLQVPISSTKSGAKSRYGGEVVSDFYPLPLFVDEGSSYIVEAKCDCRPDEHGCINDDGDSIVNSTSGAGLSGSGTSTLTIATWLNTSTSVNLDNITLKQMNTVSVNITNSRSDKRVPMDITFDCRLSNSNDNKQRIRSPFYFPECNTFGECTVKRGISSSTTQEQSIDFIVEEHPFLQGTTTEAYCSSYVNIVDIIEPGVTYATTSSVFNITSDEMNIEPDWQLWEDNKLNSIINLSADNFRDFNGTGYGNIDVRLHFDSLDEVHLTHAIELFNLIKNVTVKNATHNLTRHSNFELEFLEDNNLEIELRDVPLSKSDGNSWWNITLEFNNFDERSTEALEGIENKTGTFHFSIDCPVRVALGDDVDCVVQAQVEDQQTTQKEVDFTCRIGDYSSINFNQMVTRTKVAVPITLAAPPSEVGRTHQVDCTARYYNLGSREDSFFTTYVTGVSATTGAGGDSSSSSTTTTTTPKKGEDILELITTSEYLPLFVGFLLLLIIISKRDEEKVIPSRPAREKKPEQKKLMADDFEEGL